MALRSAVFVVGPVVVLKKSNASVVVRWVFNCLEPLTWIIHLGIGDMKSHLAGLKATFGALRILTERRSW